MQLPQCCERMSRCYDGFKPYNIYIYINLHRINKIIREHKRTTRMNFVAVCIDNNNIVNLSSRPAISDTGWPFVTLFNIRQGCGFW